MEIGGYIELDTYRGQLLHETAVRLNCGRNALAYLIDARGIRKLWMPKFMCDTCDRVLAERGVEVAYYSIGWDFKPKLKNWDGWLYVVNFYGQLSNHDLASLGDRVIVDNAQAYFQMPLPGVDTLYIPRKYFGVADGAFLYTQAEPPYQLSRDKTYDRMRHLLGRFEGTASEFYGDYVASNMAFEAAPVMGMSRLTENLLGGGIDYDFVRNIRTENFEFLHRHFGSENKLRLTVPDGAFMYPLYLENGGQIRKELHRRKIYVPTLWPSVFERCGEGELEYQMAMNILPLPVDQRYGQEEMEYMCRVIDSICAHD